MVAPLLHEALAAGEAAATGGSRAVLDAAQGVLAKADGALTLDYLALVERGTYAPVRNNDFSGPAVLAIAARLGNTRLIDNVPVEVGTERDAADG
jgi:pantoate--beta-alanine ligase